MRLAGPSVSRGGSSRGWGPETRHRGRKRRGEVFSSAPPLFTNEELERIEAQCPCSLLPRHVTRHQHGCRVRSSNVRAIVRHRSFG
ncbi:hypothetical protein V1477_016743 [Vespula maculifrons]|uniref:Uncharacterized protein n=1 Tax=Vespula maculifrons TaxID=7453 RepID=A0ABD2B401_VESMC